SVPWPLLAARHSGPILGDGNPRAQLWEQLRSPGLAGRAVGGAEGAMPEFASGPRLLAVGVQMHAGMSEDVRARRHAANQIDHRRVAESTRLPERQAGDGAHVILELARHGALDGPVPGIVHARGHLIRDEASRTHEEFDREHAHVAEMHEHAPEMTLRETLQLRPSVRRVLVHFRYVGVLTI